MEALAAGFGVLIGTSALLAIVIGAIGGAIFWRAKNGLALGGISCAAVYCFAAVSFLGSFVLAALYWGVLPLILFFLLSYLTGYHLKHRGNFGSLSATFAALAGALTAGVVYLASFRLSLWAPVVVSLIANAYLIALTFRTTRLANDAQQDA